jgi:large subunit ribosomal protein L18
MYTPPNRKRIRENVHSRIRRKLRGEAARPRLAVYRSLKHVYAQMIDDLAGTTLASASTQDKELGLKYGGNVASAKAVGKLLAERAKAAGIETVVFDRGGHRYHGRVKALADAAREAGLKF